MLPINDYDLNLPLLYSFRRCPFAMRARHAIILSGLLVKLREVSLQNKPKQMLDISPKATVPVLFLPNGEVIEESLDIVKWSLNQSDPLCLMPDRSPINDEAMRLIEQNDTEFKYHLDRYKYTERYKGSSKKHHYKEGVEIMRFWNKKIKKNGWLTSDKMSIADLAVWPFVRQWRSSNPNEFDGDQSIMDLTKWLERIVTTINFNRVMSRVKEWEPNDKIQLFPTDSKSIDPRKLIYHITSRSEWQKAQNNGTYQISTQNKLLSEVGYIHTCWEHQIRKTFDRFFEENSNNIILTIDPNRIDRPIRVEKSPDGEYFPHIYGTLELNAIVETQHYNDF